MRVVGRSAVVVRLVSPAALTATSLQQLTEEDHRPGGQQQHELLLRPQRASPMRLLITTF